MKVKYSEFCEMNSQYVRLILMKIGEKLGIHVESGVLTKTEI